MNSSWVVSVALIAKRLSARNDLQPNIARYRRLQIKYNLKKIALGEPAEADLRKLWPSLTWIEKSFCTRLKGIPVTFIRIRADTFVARWVRLAEVFAPQYPPLPPSLPKSVVGRHQNIADVYEDLGRQRCAFEGGGLRKVSAVTIVSKQTAELLCPYCGGRATGRIVGHDINRRVSEEKFTR